MNYRIERDTMGDVKVPKNRYWGAQTQRSKDNFKIDLKSPMPIEIIYAYAILKKAAAQTNSDLGVLSLKKSKLISLVCDEILEGKHDFEFPLVVWQTGSGTQTNMNINEVIANRAHVINGGDISDKEKILHPNDDVNKSQSSNDTFPTAMTIASYKILVQSVIPNLEKLSQEIKNKSKSFMKIVKIGRTHLMDATPLTLGQEFSSYHSQLEFGIKSLKNSLIHLSELAIGGTAVGTGINSPEGYRKLVIEKINNFSKLPLKPATNLFESISSHDSIVESHAALKMIAISLHKIANDIRMLASGPRSGISEIIIPTNEPGSSIMPGKVNPTQCEAITMVSSQVIGNDTTISFAAANGHYQLNAFKPVIISNFLNSARLIADSCESFRVNCIKGILPNFEEIKKNLNNSLMLVTALNNKIGYEKAAEIAKMAFKNGTTLKEESVNLGYLTEKQFDNWVNPLEMCGLKDD